jgi:ADP-ribose pyrophosphatase YjhB (NUDIX family)
VLAAKLLRPRFRVAVSALVFDERQRILLFKHTYRKLEWGLPAGALEYGEQPVDGILREFDEETGMKIAVERLLLADSNPHMRHVSLVYLCRIVSGEFRDSDEISEIGYFDVNSLPPMLFDEKDLIRSIHRNLFGMPSP